MKIAKALKGSRTAIPWFALGVCVIFIIVVTEFLGWVGYSILGKGIATYGRSWASMQSVRGLEVKEAPQPQNGMRVIHPYLGFVTPPHSTDPFLRNALQPMETYGFGVDAGPLVREKRSDQYVIGLFGGSVAVRYRLLGGDKTMVDILKKDPRFAGKTIIVSSAAFDSYRQPQQLLTLSYLLSIGGHFDMVLSIDGFNDIYRPTAEAKNSLVSPLYPYGWADYVSNMDADTVLRLKMGKTAVLIDKRFRWSQWFLNSPLKFSWAAQFIWKAGDMRLSAALSNAYFDLEQYKDREGQGYSQRGPVPYYMSDDEYFLDRASVWKEGAIQMYNLAKANGAEYFHILQPNQYVPRSKPLSKDEWNVMYGPGGHEETSIRDAVHDGYPYLRKAGEEILKETDMPFIDLTNIFENVSETLYIDDCCHFNAKGEEILGRRIAKFILDEMDKQRKK